MAKPYDRNALWDKAVLFTNRSQAAREAAAFDEAALWAAFALELLAKAALAKLSPLLVADPVDDGKSLLIAAGVLSEAGSFKSIPAKGLFSRCARAFPPFNAQEAGLIAHNRNEHLHSAVLPFAAIPEDKWWQRYWAQAVLLVSAQDRTLEDLVGHTRLAEIERVLAEAQDTLMSRLAALIGRAQQRLALTAAGEISAAVAKELATATSAHISLTYETPQECPACGGAGSLAGEYGQEGSTSYDEDGYAYQDVSVYAEMFTCVRCGLVLDGPEFLAAAGLPEAWEFVQEAVPDWDDYGND